uniref:Uncharacterized protein n=1 Tax=Anguilla anguilla TaxID=7936 RepID=A0A0E9QW74_ANGAN
MSKGLGHFTGHSTCFHIGDKSVLMSNCCQAIRRLPSAYGQFVKFPVL